MSKSITTKKSGYKGQKASLKEGKKFLPECSLKQLELIDEMKYLSGEPVTVSEINTMLGEENYARVGKVTRSGSSLAKNLHEKGYFIKTTKKNKIAYALNMEIFKPTIRQS